MFSANYVRQRTSLLALGLMGALSLWGCARDINQDKKEPGPKAGHKHPDEGPHGGALAEWGNEEFHAEFLVDHGKKEATVYILDGLADKTVPIKEESLTLIIKNVQPPANIILKADPQKDDPKDRSSRFTGRHDALGKEMEFEGEISGKIGDKAYTGEFKEKAHKGHKHPKKQ